MVKVGFDNEWAGANKIRVSNGDKVLSSWGKRDVFIFVKVKEFLLVKISSKIFKSVDSRLILAHINFSLLFLGFGVSVRLNRDIGIDISDIDRVDGPKSGVK